MKTVEEKARAYDEALEKAKNEINAKGIGDTVDLCKHLFPELRESEDERIRKGLIHLISEQDGILTAINGVSVKDILAYLEKQKDASKAIEVVDRIDKYIDQQVANAHDMEDSNPDKKYYLGWDDALGEISGILKDVYSGENQKEQKSILKFKVGDKIHLIGGTSPNYEDDCITIREIGTINYIGEFKEGYVPIKEQDKWELVKEQNPVENISQLTFQGKCVYKICPYCKEHMVRDDSKVYTSIPPKYGYNCPKCGAVVFDTVIYDNPKMEESKPAEG